MSFVISDLQTHTIATILMFVSTSLMTLSNSVWSIWLLLFWFSVQSGVRLTFSNLCLEQFPSANESVAHCEGTEEEKGLKLAPLHQPKATEGLSFAVEILRPQGWWWGWGKDTCTPQEKNSTGLEVQPLTAAQRAISERKGTVSPAPGSSKEFRKDTLTRFSGTMNKKDFCWREFIQIPFNLMELSLVRQKSNSRNSMWLYHASSWGLCREAAFLILVYIHFMFLH